jgi:hypothetical protein
MPGVSVDVFHPAVFADSQPFASGLQFFFADLVFFTRLQAFGGAFVGGGHGAVALDVFLGFLLSWLCCAWAMEKSALSATAAKAARTGETVRNFLMERTLVIKIYLDWRSSNTLTR